MIDNKIIRRVIESMTEAELKLGLLSVVKHFMLTESWNYDKLVNNLMLVSLGEKDISENDIKLSYIRENASEYFNEKVEPDSIEIIGVDAISNIVKLSYRENDKNYIYDKDLEIENEMLYKKI